MSGQLDAAALQAESIRSRTGGLCSVEEAFPIGLRVFSEFSGRVASIGKQGAFFGRVQQAKGNLVGNFYCLLPVPLEKERVAQPNRCFPSLGRIARRFEEFAEAAENLDALFRQRGAGRQQPELKIAAGPIRHRPL